VRLHRVDENASGEVAPLLAWLRELQRRYDVAIIVVHHAKKGAPAHQCCSSGQEVQCFKGSLSPSHNVKPDRCCGQLDDATLRGTSTS
jgi:hypothetical protein